MRNIFSLTGALLMPMLKMSDVDLKGMRVLIREDLNVPLKHGKITSDLRIQAAIPTIKQALKAGAQVMLMSHLGRPEENGFNEAYSLAPIAERLSQLLKQEVPLISKWLQGYSSDAPIVLFENVRFNHGETKNNLELAKKMAHLCDVFVMDAFATSHRAESSTCGIIQYAPIACAGPLLVKELTALAKIMQKPQAPVVAIVGGSKVSTKLALLDALSQKVDYIILGGGIANTFIAMQGYTVGKSLYEPDLIDEAERLMQTAAKHGGEIIVPTDVIIGERLADDSESAVRLISQIDDDERVYDIGPDTTKKLISIIKKAKTILWNGPLGAFEIEQFSRGTRAIGKAVSECEAFTVAGGGDTIAAIEAYKIADKIDYISTGGGAFLSFLEGKKLAAITALEERAIKDEKVT
jgi:phosphoglycerate kinase